MTGAAADYFMGGISMVVGAVALLASVFNWDAAFRLRKTRWLDERWGRARTRLAMGVLGAALITLGVAISMGFAPNA